MASTDATLYVSTQAGLFQRSLRARADDVKPLGLQRYGRVWPIVIDRDDPSRLYAATHRGGVFRSDDAGRSWQEKNEGLLYKETWCIVQHPTSGDLFVGTGPAAIFKSSDRAETWTHCEQLHTLPETKDWTFPGPPHIAHVKGLGLCQDDPALVYAAIEEGWVVRSRDAGASWTTLKSGSEFDAHTVNVMPNDPNVVISASGTGVYRSEDGGDHFVDANDGLTRRYISQIVLHAQEPSVLFTAAAEVPPPFWRRPEGANAGFFKSVDQGRHWDQLSGGLPQHFSAAPRATTGDPRTPGSFLVGMSDGSIWMTNDGGERFEQIGTGLPPIFGLTISAN